MATAEGYAPGSAFLDETRALLTAQGSSLTSSMYRDPKKNKPIEAEEIIGDLLARGNRAGVHTPLLETAYTHLAIFQHQLRGR